MRSLLWLVMALALTAAVPVRSALAQPEAAQPEAAKSADAAEGEGAEHAAGEHHELGHGNAASDMDSPAAFRGDLAIYTFAVFVLLLAILSKAAWPKISTALAERETRIEGAIAAAAAKHEEAKRLLAEHEAKLAGAAAEVKAMLDEARRDAEATKTEIVAEARAAAKQEHERARRDIDQALDTATKGLAETSANLAVDLAGKVLRETINPAKQQELVRDALKKLAAAAPSRN